MLWDGMRRGRLGSKMVPYIPQASTAHITYCKPVCGWHIDCEPIFGERAAIRKNEIIEMLPHRRIPPCFLLSSALPSSLNSLYPIRGTARQETCRIYCLPREDHVTIASLVWTARSLSAAAALPERAPKTGGRSHGLAPSMAWEVLMWQRRGLASPCRYAAHSAR